MSDGDDGSDPLALPGWDPKGPPPGFTAKPDRTWMWYLLAVVVALVVFGLMVWGFSKSSYAPSPCSGGVCGCAATPRHSR